MPGEADRRQRDHATLADEGRGLHDLPGRQLGDRPDLFAVGHRAPSLPTRFRSLLQRPPHALRRQRQVADDHARGVAHRGADRGGDTQAVRPRSSPWSRRARGRPRSRSLSLISSSGQVHAGGDPVVDGPEVPDPAGLVEDVVLHQGVAQALDRRPLVLHPHLERVEGLADVGHRDVADHRDVAGLLVDVDLDGRAVELEEAGAPWSGWSGSASLRISPLPMISPPIRPRPAAGPRGSAARGRAGGRRRDRR